jgi:hypothetical protein
VTFGEIETPAGVFRLLTLLVPLTSALIVAFSAVRAAGAAPLCDPKPVATIRTAGMGAEDIVALPLGDGRVRLFVREVCRGRGCEPTSDRFRIGFADVTAEAIPAATEHAWRPAGAFEPLGMSLVLGQAVGDATLYVLDAVKPPRIWRLQIVGGVIQPSAGPWIEDEHALKAGNDIQAVGDHVHVTRFDGLGFLPVRFGSWRGLVKVGPGQGPVPYAEGFRGANGVVDLGDDLLVSDYWGRRLRRVSKDPGREGEPRFASAKLPIHPDNLTLDRDRVVIAGQKFFFFTALNIFAGFGPSPSSVLAIPVARLGPEAKPTVLWSGGWSHGRSVSVAVPVAGRLALGQIRAPGVLIVRCPPEP